MGVSSPAWPMPQLQQAQWDHVQVKRGTPGDGDPLLPGGPSQGCPNRMGKAVS